MTKKSFDAVAFQRQRRAELGAIMDAMTHDEQLRYIQEKLRGKWPIAKLASRKDYHQSHA